MSPLLATIQDPGAALLATQVKQVRADLSVHGLDYFLPYQKAWIDDASPLSIGEKSRRIGWTYASSYRAVERRVRGGQNLYFTSADFTAGREFVDYCKVWCEVFNQVAAYHEAEETVPVEDAATGRVVDERKIHTMNVTFENGRKIVAGSSNPTFYRSKGGDADADEFAFHRAGRDLYKAAHATALFWGHQLRLWSTHNGPGSYFNQMIQQARAGRLKARLHKVTIVDAVEQGLVEKIKRLAQRDDRARQEWLDELRATCPDADTWNEEYMCVPSSDQSALLTYALIQGCEESTLPVVDDLTKLQATGVLYAGADVGRKHDLTTIWVDERVGDVAWNRLLKRMRDVPFSVQLDVFSALLMNPAVRRLCIDATGLGMMLAELLVQRFGPHRVEAVTFTGAVKGEIAMPFVRRFQDRAARIPAEDDLRESLHAVRKTVTAAGNVRLDASRDDAGHADEFWAGALACHASDPLAVPLPPPLAELPEAMV